MEEAAAAEVAVDSVQVEGVAVVTEMEVNFEENLIEAFSKKIDERFDMSVNGYVFP